MHHHSCLIFFCVMLSLLCLSIILLMLIIWDAITIFVINLSELLKGLEMMFLSKYEFFHNASKAAKYLPGHPRDWSLDGKWGTTLLLLRMCTQRDQLFTDFPPHRDGIWRYNKSAAVYSF